MIKVHDDTARKIVVFLRYLMGVVAENGIPALRTNVIQETRRGPHQWDSYINSILVNHTPQGEWNIPGIINELMTTMYAGGEANEPGNLIEDLADILKEPLSRNMFGRETIDQLRHLILLPDERAIAGSLPRTFSCAHCGRAIPQQRGVAVTHTDGAFYCTACIRGTQFLCSTPGCEEIVTGQTPSIACHAHGGAAQPPVDNSLGDAMNVLRNQAIRMPSWASNLDSMADIIPTRPARRATPTANVTPPPPRDRDRG